MSYQVQELQSDDLGDAARLIDSFWGLNVEFEPSIMPQEGAIDQIKEELEQALGRDDQIILVARSDKTLLGIIRVEIKKAKFRGPGSWANIVEFYVLPRERRKDVAKNLLDSATAELKKKGIKMLTAEFPTQNVPATSFYERIGFHPFETVYVKELE
jgi:ribosomal protein S18 acetylase RimI-like enzyme